MKVSEIITRLSQNYQPDDELFIAWWDRETTTTYDEEIGDYVEVPDAVWRAALQLMDSDPMAGDYLFEGVHEFITDNVDCVRRQITNAPVSEERIILERTPITAEIPVTVKDPTKNPYNQHPYRDKDGR